MNDNIIRTRKGMNGPLGEVTSISGDEAHYMLYLMTLRSALALFMEHNIIVSPHFSMKVVKGVTHKNTNDKQKQLDALDELIKITREQVTYIEETDYCAACQQHKPCSCDNMIEDRKG